MPDYTPTDWVDNVTPVNASNMDKLEGGVDANAAAIDANTAAIATINAKPQIPTPVVNGQWIKGSGGALVWSAVVIADVTGLQTALDAKVDDTEKGAVSGVATLDSASRVVQKATVDKIYSVGEVEGTVPTVRSGATVWETPSAGGADLGTSLPLTPFNGQEFLLVSSLTNPTYAWKFIYMADISDAYKWVYIGGAPYALGPVNQSVGAGAYVDVLPFILPVPGIYMQRAEARSSNQFANSAYTLGCVDPAVGDVVVTVNSWSTDRDSPYGGQVVWGAKAAGTTLAVRCLSGGGGGTVTFNSVRNFITPNRVS